MLATRHIHKNYRKEYLSPTCSKPNARLAHSTLRVMSKSGLASTAAIISCRHRTLTCHTSMLQNQQTQKQNHKEHLNFLVFSLYMENPFFHLVQNAQFTSCGDVAARDPVRGWLGGGWYSWLHSCFIFECFKSKASSGFANARLTGPRPEMRYFGIARGRFLSASQRCTSHWLLGVCCWQIPPTEIAAFCNVLHVPFLKPWLTQCPRTVE